MSYNIISTILLLYYQYHCYHYYYYVSRHGPHSLTYHSILTLEEKLTQKQKKIVKGEIIEGWLQDEIIGAFFYKICLGRSDLKYCEAALALSLARFGTVHVSPTIISNYLYTYL